MMFLETTPCGLQSLLALGVLLLEQPLALSLGQPLRHLDERVLAARVRRRRLAAEVVEHAGRTGAVARVGSGAPPELRRHGLAPPRREWGSRPVGDVVTPDGFGGSTANARIVRQQRRQAPRHFN